MPPPSEKAAKILELYAAGYRPKEIALQVHCRRDYVYRVLGARQRKSQSRILEEHTAILSELLVLVRGLVRLPPAVREKRIAEVERAAEAESAALRAKLIPSAGSCL